MSELRKANTNYPYFLTFTIVGWIDLFTRNRYYDLIVENLNYCIKNKGLEVFAYVIMPSHVHLIARQMDNKLAEIIRDFKSFTAKSIIDLIEKEQGESRKEWLLHLFKYYAKHQQQNSNYRIWQKTNHPIELNYNEIIDEKVTYIHENPVAAGLVISPEHWVYSSACLQNSVSLAEL